MTVLSVVKDVCAVVGVVQPSSIFSGIASNRTMQEMLALANEMAQRIAYDYRDWTALKLPAIPGGAIHTGDGVTTAFNLPANYKRMLLTANVRKSTNPRQPLRFILDYDQWTERRLSNNASYPSGEWMIAGGKIHIFPVMAAAVFVTYSYMDKNCVSLASGGYGAEFLSDNDTFRLDERLLKLGMIWQWKANKGSPYAEDLSNYGDAITTVMGKDGPSPIIVGRLPISAGASVAYPWPVPT